MFRLASILFSIIATACAGTGVIVALTMGWVTLAPILTGAAIGLAVAVPVTWIVTKRISGQL